MFAALVESRPRRQRGAGGMTASIVAHAAVIALAVQLAARRAPPPPREPAEVVHLPMPASPPVASAHPAGGGTTAGGGRVDRGTLPAEPGIHVDLRIPGLPHTGPSLYEELGHVLADMGGGAPGAGGESAGEGSSAAGVDVQARPLPGNPDPVYPSILRARGIEGRVVARFVVDSTGRVERGSIRLAATGSDLFAAAVRRALEQARFIPARAAGHPVPVLMERTFVFRIGWR